jgi:hypothetical protein
VSHSRLSPSSWNGQENFWQLQNKFRLLIRCQPQVPITLSLRCEGGKDPASYTEIDRPHVRAFLCPFDAQSNPAEIRCIHLELLPFVIDDAAPGQFWNFSGLSTKLDPGFVNCCFPAAGRLTAEVDRKLYGMLAVDVTVLTLLIATRYLG